MEQAARATPAPDKVMLRRAVAASIIGNGLEWYDFLIYGFFATAIARTFFPSDDPTASLMATFATFVVGFLVRPFGGILMGAYADRAGRRAALTLMIALMVAGTGIIALTPGFATIGAWAPILILLARVLQGLSVGGEFASATAMLVEYAPKERKYFFGSFQMLSQALALVVASVVAVLITSLLPPDAAQGWGWRLAFLLGLLIGPVGVFIRRRVDESPEFVRFAKEREDQPRLPIGPALRGYGQAILFAMGVIIAGTISNYLWFVYTPVYAVRELGLAQSTAYLSGTIAGLFLLVVTPVTGWLADRVGPLTIYVPGAVALGALAWPMFAYVGAVPDARRLIAVQLLAALFMGMIWGPLPNLLASRFPVAVRSTAMAIAYNTAVTLFGGMAPLIVTWLLGLTGDKLVPAYYIIAGTVIALTLMTASRPRTVPAMA